MEKVVELYGYLLKGYGLLEEMIEYLDAAKSHRSEVELVIAREALIKRFEICYELTWKYLKIYLEDMHGVLAASPRKVFHECLAQNITDEQETGLLFAMIDDRNLTSHIYDERVIVDIVAHLPKYLDLFKKLSERTKPASKS